LISNLILRFLILS